MGVVEIKSDEQFTQLTTAVDSKTVVALYFNTPWAEPCKRMTQVFESLASSIDDSNKAVFLSINAEEHPDISESFDVSAVPYFVLLRNSTIIKELSGADPKELVNTVQALVEGKSPEAEDSTPAPATNGVQQEEKEETEEELNNRLSKLVKAAPVMLFMKGTPSQPQCGFSRTTVGILREHQVQFGFFDILKDDSVRQGLKKFSDWPTFPQLYMNGELQGGLDIIKESIAEDPDFFKQASS